MKPNRQTILQLLKKELEFLESGGYRHGRRSLWRAAYIFEESPSCPNYSDKARSTECADCWLMEFVPPELREEQVPCRFVELGANAVTVDSLYRCGTQAESEEALKNWLHVRIRDLEEQVRESKELKLA